MVIRACANTYSSLKLNQFPAENLGLSFDSFISFKGFRRYFANRVDSIVAKVLNQNIAQYIKLRVWVMDDSATPIIGHDNFC